MTKINKQALKAYFQTGKIPTQSNFADLIDSVMNIPDGGGREKGFNISSW